jgi:putative alpha-1,2-mannosidase
MSENSIYYEGDKYTYSFRIQNNMEERVELAGGKEKFAKLLDDFFGFNGESIKPMRHFSADADIAATNYHRFQGFNNECDLEAPYAYIYADRHDRLCEIVHECVHRSFGMGKGGLPGNNDSGGLSSCFVWNALGIFPISGKGEFLIGAPQFDESVINLANGKTLTLKAYNRNDTKIYVDKVFLNGKKIENYKISTKDIINGGILEFYMK